MHTGGGTADTQEAYPEGVTANVRAFFQTMAQQAERFGIPGHALCMDLALDLENRIKKT